MRYFVIAALLGYSAWSAKTDSFTGDSYDALSASAKSDQIWESVIADTTSYGWYSLARISGGILAEGMSTTMQYRSDAMPSTWSGERNKYIHSVGTVAKCKFVSSGQHPFTGIFEGADHGIVRLSVAQEPNKDVQNIAPGIALKFMRDGLESVSLVSMYSVDGQPSWNFFANDFTSHIPDATKKALWPLEKAFATASDYITATGISDFAART